MNHTPKGADVIAANPGPAMHMALLGIVIVIGLVVFAVVRIRNRREAAEAEKLSSEERRVTGDRHR